MAQQRKPVRRGRPRTTDGKRAGKPINVWVSNKHRAAIDELMRRSRRTLTAEIEVIIEEAAARAGLWIVE